MLIAGNWKMNCTIEEAVQLSSAIRQGLGAVIGVEVVLCPPFIDLQAVQSILKETGIQLGAQNVYHEDAGAYTGEISPRMLEGLCRFAIVGHSERRQLLGDSDEAIARKVYALVRHNITPILCIGETLSEYDANQTSAVLERQLMAVLRESEPIPNLVIAYEPVWAIGTGKSADAEAINATVSAIRSLLASTWGANTGEEIRILYGGSVTSGNVAAYARQPEVDGALVGGASLRAQEFCDIVFAAASTRR